MIIAIVIFSITTLLFLYSTINLLFKVEKLEDQMINQNKVMLNIDKNIKEARDFINSVDERGIFQSDDEVGTFFGYLQDIQNTLDQYSLQENAEKTKE